MLKQKRIAHKICFSGLFYAKLGKVVAWKPPNNDQIIEQITVREDFLPELQIQNG